MKLILRVLPIALALLLPSAALAAGTKAGAKGQGAQTAHAKAVKKTKVKPVKKPAKVSKAKAARKPSTRPAPARKS